MVMEISFPIEKKMDFTLPLIFPEIIIGSSSHKRPFNPLCLVLFLLIKEMINDSNI